MRAQWTGWLLVPVIAASLLACAGSSSYMKKVGSLQAIAVATDRATVVFIRPSGLGFAINFAILDQQGHWVGDAVSESHFAALLPPGEYMFVAWAENTAALKATLGAGRVYYVQVDPAMGAFSARVFLEALTPRSDDWKKVSGWLKGTNRLEPLPTGAAYIEGRHIDAMKRVTSANENWVGYTAEEKQRRTLLVEDGILTSALPAAAIGP
jgi:hypothetical protein